MVQHLGANNVDLATTPLTLGIPLPVDAMAERITGPDAERANALLQDEYRAPFMVPTVA
jgi:hypothetical protein